MNYFRKKYRIFQLLPGSGTIASSVKSSVWQNNLYKPLLEMGHDVVSIKFYYDQFFVHAENSTWLSEQRKNFSQVVLDSFTYNQKEKPFDFCFFYLLDDFIDDAVFEQIHKKGVVILNYSCNNIHQFHLIKKTSKLVDLNIFAEHDAKLKFERIGVNAVQMQMAANPNVYKPMNLEYKYDVSFVGQRYADRGKLSSYLVENGIDIHLFGPRWDPVGEKVGNYKTKDLLDKLFSITKQYGFTYILNYAFSYFNKKNKDNKENKLLANHVGGILSDEEMIKLFSKSKINLGFSTVFQDGRAGGKQMAHLRLRDFEIPMSGGFYLTKYTEELENYFEIGKEIETYSDNRELLDKIKFYLANEKIRDDVRQAGLKRSLKSHTWQHRYEKLFSSKKFTDLF